MSMFRLSRLSIRSKLVITFVAAVLLALMMAGFFFAAMESSRIAALGREHSLAVQRVLNAQGDLAAVKLVAIPPNMLPSQWVQLITNSGDVLIDTRDYSRNEPQLNMQLNSYPIVVDGTVWGRYLIANQRMSFDPLFNFASHIPSHLSAGVFFAFVASLLLFWFFGLHLVEPVQQISRVVERLAAGDLAARVRLTNRGDELGKLAQDVDIMALKFEWAKRQGEAAEQSRRYLLAAVSHDLRTPLTLILAHAEALRNGVSDDAEHSMAVIEERALLLKRLIDDLFELASLDSTETEPQMQPVNLGELMRRSVAAILPALEEAQAELDVDIPDQPLWVEASLGKLERVIDNILTNTCKYGLSGKWVGVRALAINEVVRVEISDQGPGLAHWLKVRIFDRFYRADSSRTTAVGGSGLGLAIAKEIIVRHGGTIGVDTPEEGGSIFWFELPASPPVSGRGKV